MQYAADGTLVFSPSDITEFMASPFASWMSRFFRDHSDLVEPEDDATAVVLQKHGGHHEVRVLARLRDELGLDVVEIPKDVGADERERLTREAIAAEREVIVEARLVLAPFAGYADFLIHPRVRALALGVGPREPEAVGAYQIWDAKLAHSAKPYHLMQLCAYVEMLEAWQGERDEEIVVALGSGELARFRIEDHFYQFQALRQRFLEWMENYDETVEPFPDPSHKHRRWQAEADRRIAESDHTSRVAQIRRSQWQKLESAGIRTMAQLAMLAGNGGASSVAGIQPATLRRLAAQARLQKASEGLAVPAYEVLPASEVQGGKGLASLPPASPGDVFFDIEGYPLADGGLEYLWGVAYRGVDGAPAYQAFWAHDADEEEAVLAEFTDWVCARRAEHPEMHVYHYAPYEVTAIKRLMGRTGVREAEIAELLFGGVFVDLYQVVRHAVRVGEPRYSIKNVERLYRGARAGEVTSGLDSVVAYEEWLTSGEARDPAASKRLEDIRAYNEDDCVSTLELQEWLHARQREVGIAYVPRRVVEKDEEKIEVRRERQKKQRALVDALRDELPAEPPPAPEAAEAWRVQRLLADLVEFHAREARPVFWELADRANMTPAERAEQLDCLAELERTQRAPFGIKSSKGYEYRFDPEQDTKIRVGSKCRVAEEHGLEVEVAEFDAAKGTLVLKVTDKRVSASSLGAMPERLCLIQFDYRGTEPLETAIEETAQRWLDDRQITPALRNMLVRQPPQLGSESGGGALRTPGQPDGGALRAPHETAGAALVRIVNDLQTSTLAVQGPPGSGKTTLGARAIVSLLAAGKKVGVTSNSHKAIGNLLNACGEEARREGVSIRIVKVGSDKADQQVDGEPGAIGCVSKAVEGELKPGTVVGATAWCFSRGELAGNFDQLFVDEAGQVSLANLVAVGRCADNLVLLGDPAQLPQPLRGVHPGESGRSALEYFVPGGHAVIDEGQGLFLEDTHRLHPSLCHFISGAFYEGRLRPAAGNERRILLPASPPAAPSCTPTPLLPPELEAGLFHLPVAHTGNRQASDEEVAVIRTLFAELLGRPYRQRERGKESATRLGVDDILVVAPYNLQVGRLIEALPAGAQVGTVDKFQGQQAAVVIVSLCASDGGAASRGLEFLLNPNRLNVALSRAQCLCVVVASPEIADTPCTSIKQLALLNTFCRIQRYALGGPGD